ncbi:hypothetical protein TPHA_0C01250 [Tetrapisispora phaffii CBS 4417]|uniref:Complex 1 LYR protein domain-containing protein n=1 Tax=Tetrapisispora phaffii (strain ATCC 24235 / CBS 4417 / NBRC 1672 / NRRL Y-8282 / UCD 70-5) TaxID=1071381 RepID=G8BRA5_TETPH|nr:hypothetical protein TPHA_0C01250 [Tetrapisispora phaffii CBS 4417]CCE62281.1 hypothetical protein TPHA_0C01250 [Tetrapisispora phaffii CBS 4417]
MGAVGPTRIEVLHLYKQLIKNSRLFNDYNFREFFLRRSRESFKANKHLNDSQAIIDCYNRGLEDLSVLKRQSIISQLYTFDKLVVEPLKGSR